MRRVILIGGILAGVTTGCFPHRNLRIGDEVAPPRGLDSLGTATWIAQQRARCPGDLRFNVDHMPTVSLDGSPVPFQSGIISVACVPRSPSPSRPSA